LFSVGVSGRAWAPAGDLGRRALAAELQASTAGSPPNAVGAAARDRGSTHPDRRASYRRCREQHQHDDRADPAARGLLDQNAADADAAMAMIEDTAGTR